MKVSALVIACVAFSASVVDAKGTRGGKVAAEDTVDAKKIRALLSKAKHNAAQKEKQRKFAKIPRALLSKAASSKQNDIKTKEQRELIQKTRALVKKAADAKANGRELSEADQRALQGAALEAVAALLLPFLPLLLPLLLLLPGLGLGGFNPEELSGLPEGLGSIFANLEPALAELSPDVLESALSEPEIFGSLFANSELKPENVLSFLDILSPEPGILGEGSALSDESPLTIFSGGAANLENGLAALLGGGPSELGGGLGGVGSLEGGFGSAIASLEGGSSLGEANTADIEGGFLSGNAFPEGELLNPFFGGRALVKNAADDKANGRKLSKVHQRALQDTEELILLALLLLLLLPVLGGGLIPEGLGGGLNPEELGGLPEGLGSIFTSLEPVLTELSPGVLGSALSEPGIFGSLFANSELNPENILSFLNFLNPEPGILGEGSALSSENPLTIFSGGAADFENGLGGVLAGGPSEVGGGLSGIGSLEGGLGSGIGSLEGGSGAGESNTANLEGGLESGDVELFPFGGRN